MLAAPVRRVSLFNCEARGKRSLRAKPRLKNINFYRSSGVLETHKHLTTERNVVNIYHIIASYSALRYFTRFAIYTWFTAASRPPAALNRVKRRVELFEEK